MEADCLRMATRRGHPRCWTSAAAVAGRTATCPGSARCTGGCAGLDPGSARCSSDLANSLAMRVPTGLSRGLQVHGCTPSGVLALEQSSQRLRRHREASAPAAQMRRQMVACKVPQDLGSLIRQAPESSAKSAEAGARGKRGRAVTPYAQKLRIVCPIIAARRPPLA